MTILDRISRFFGVCPDCGSYNTSLHGVCCNSSCPSHRWVFERVKEKLAKQESWRRQLALDARRYRWLREQEGKILLTLDGYVHGEALDRAVDVAIAAEARVKP